MKKALLFVLLALVTTFARANEINFTNQFGTANVTYAGIFSKGVELVGFNGIHAKPGHSLGSVYFKTGALETGSVLGGGTFTQVSSLFTITGNGHAGVPKGVIFYGQFTAPIVWTLLSHVGQTYNFSLTGTIYGAIWDGRTVTGTTTQYITLAHNQWVVDHHGKIGLGGGALPTPEPSTLSLLGTGIVALAGVFRRKMLVVR